VSKIKIIIVDDEVNWLKAMSQFLNKEEDMIVVGTASNKEEALRLVHKPGVDLMLMNINLTQNNLDGIHLAKEILNFCNIKIIMLTCLEEEKVIIDSYTAGAVNFVAKTDYKEIPQVIRSAVHKTSPFEILLKEYLRLKEEEQLKTLTPVEREIYDLLAKNYSRKKIADFLYKTESTIKKQIKSILKKLGASNREEAIKKVKNRGLK
jgi:NarL family two-component system response regulator LiaR